PPTATPTRWQASGGCWMVRTTSSGAGAWVTGIPGLPGWRRKSMPSAPSIRVEYRPSRWQRALSTVLVIAAGVTLAFAAWPLAARLAALVVYAGCTLFVIRRLQRTHWTAVSWAGDGSWRIALEDGKEHAAVLIE